ELDAREAQARHLCERACGERLREAGIVLEQDVAVGQQAEQHELELLALADDGALDLVEDPPAQDPNLLEPHASSSSDEMIRSSWSAWIPVSRRSPGGPGSARGRPEGPA